MLLYFVLREGLRFEIKKASFTLRSNTLDPLHKIEKKAFINVIITVQTSVSFRQTRRFV